MNPASGAKQGQGQGQGQDLASHLRRQFDSVGLQARILMMESPDETANAIRTACAAGTTTVVAAGGDGTVSTVAAALVGVNTPLGVLPLGTLNHFAKDLKIPLQLDQAVQTIAAHHVTQVDVGEVNGRVFVNNSSIGIYPSIVVERERLRERGYRKWTAFAVATAKVIRSHRGLAITIRTGGSTERSRTPFLFVGNNAYRVDGIRIGGRDRLDGGQLFAYLAPRVHGYELVRLVASACMGRVGAHDTLESFGTLELRVDTPGRHHVRVANDGEVTTMTPPLLYRARPRALNVIVPPPTAV